MVQRRLGALLRCGAAGARQQVATSPFLVAGVVCEEVLEKLRRCFAYDSGLAYANGIDERAGEVPGAMAAAGWRKQ